MSESAIEKELVEATSLSSKKNEDRQKYLARLMKAASKLDDDEWADLSTEAQKWNNDAATDFKSGNAIEDFPDLETEEETDQSEVEIAPEEAADEESPPLQPEKDEEQPKGRAGKSGRPVAAKKTSACHAIKTLVVKKPDISVKELSEKLKQKGLKVSDVTIATLRSDTRDTLRVLNESGAGDFKL